jgi:hypothetical protein
MPGTEGQATNGNDPLSMQTIAPNKEGGSWDWAAAPKISLFATAATRKASTTA